MNPRNFFAELKRRNVYKVAVAYAVVAWLLIQAASILFPTFEAPAWVMKVFIAAVALGFPIALIFAWAFELTPEGIKRTEDVASDESITHRTGRKLTLSVAAVALLAIGLLLFQMLRPRVDRARPGSSSPTREQQRIPEKSIAVLPFESLSEDKANAYFATGVQDEILTRLAKVAELKVISRTSTQQYQSKPGSVAEIAKQLGVAHILEGSVQKAGDSVRVNVQLIKADTDSHLWAETYDRKLTDIFAVETEIAERIARSLEAKLTGREKEAISYVGTKNPAAYDAYLRAIALRNSQSRQDQERLLQFSRQAVALDPNFAAAWAEIAYAEGLKYIQGHRTAAQEALAKEAAANALRLDPDHGNGHAAWGLYLYYCLQDYDGALIELQQARQQSPNEAVIIQAIGLVKRRQGKLDESVELQVQAAALDPRNQDIWANLGFTYRGMRNLPEARAMFDRALAIAPNDPSILSRKADTYIAEGDLTIAARLYDELPFEFMNEGYEARIRILALQRKYEEALAKILADMKKAAAPEPADLAFVHLLLGELHVVSGRRPQGDLLLAQAEAELKALRDQGNNNPDLVAGDLEIQALLGNRAEVERIAPEFVASHAKDRWRGPSAEQAATRAYMILGDKERVLANLERLLVILGRFLDASHAADGPVVGSDPERPALSEAREREAMNLRSFFAELKRRNVYKVAVAYGVVAWLVIQISDTVFPRLNLPDWAVTLVIVLLLLGLPVALVLAWAFELTPEGVVRAEDVAPDQSIARKTGRKLTVVIVLVGVLAAALFALQFFVRSSAPSAPKGVEKVAVAEKSIAVLPFENRSEDKANAYFADGIQDEILTRLAKIDDLKVISRTSTQRYKSSPENLPEIAKQLGVAHVLEGSVQKAGDQVRVNVQLINPRPTRISGRKFTTGNWPTSSSCRARSRKQSRRLCR